MMFQLPLLRSLRQRRTICLLCSVDMASSSFERVWPGNRLQAGAEPTAIHHWAPTRARQRAAGLRLEQDLVGLAGWRLYNEAPEFAQGVLINRLRSLSHGRALPAGEEDDLARA